MHYLCILAAKSVYFITQSFQTVYNFSMYIIELIAKLIKHEKKEKPNNMPPEIDYENTCEHIFLPVDSTGETLACSKCGLVVKNDPTKVKPKNPFTM